LSATVTESSFHALVVLQADFYDHFLYVSLNLVSLEYTSLDHMASPTGKETAGNRVGAIARYPKSKEALKRWMGVCKEI